MYFGVLCCNKASSTSANELSQQWAVHHSTAHRFEIRRALYLIPSNNKNARPQNAHLRLSKLRFFGLRMPKTTSFSSTSKKTPRLYKQKTTEQNSVATKLNKKRRALDLNGDSRRADTINGAGASRAINHLSIGSTSHKRAISVPIEFCCWHRHYLFIL